MSWSRREILAASAWAAQCAMPAFLRRAAAAAGESQDTILVVVQLTGGNDGLNTVVPYAHPAYAAARPTLRQSAEAVIRLTDEIGLHPSLRGMADLHENGRLAIVQGVGYPNPNRSHFTSLDIWHKAQLDPASEPLGWLGRATAEMGVQPGSIYVGDGETPLALFGASGYAPSLNSLDDYRLRISDAGRLAAVESFAAEKHDESPLLARLRASARDTYASASRVQDAAQRSESPVDYPQTPLGNHLRLIARFIEAGIPERVYYAALAGFDTHAGQAATHGELLQTLSDAIAAFQQDLSAQGSADRVLMMTFSEFGRRVKENGSLGTDHGTAAPMFFVGSRLRAGAIGPHPDLEDLDAGDLKFHTDFRSVYATVLENWLGVSAEAVLSAHFPPIDLIAESTQPS